MKKLLLFGILLFPGIKHAFSQTGEWTFHAGSGMFGYHFSPADSGPVEPYYSMLNIRFADLAGYRNVYANNPWGRRSGFSFDISAGYKWITVRNLITEFGIIGESRQSVKTINWIRDINTTMLLPSSGKAILTNQMIGLSFFTGKRIPLKNRAASLDLMVGADVLGQFGAAHQHSNAVVLSTGQPMSVNTTDSKLPGNEKIDVRLRVKVQYILKHWGIDLGYALGIVNEQAETDIPTFGARSGSYSRYISGGILYRILARSQKRK